MLLSLVMWIAMTLYWSDPGGEVGVGDEAVGCTKGEDGRADAPPDEETDVRHWEREGLIRRECAQQVGATNAHTNIASTFHPHR